MPTLVACLWRRVEAIQLGRVPTHFGPATRLRRPESPWNQGALATSQVEMCPRTANSGSTTTGVWERVFRHSAGDADDEYPMIDGTVVRAHQHSAGAVKKAAGATGRSGAAKAAWARRS